MQKQQNEQNQQNRSYPEAGASVSAVIVEVSTDAE
jgi:hypothetical protein